MCFPLTFTCMSKAWWEYIQYHYPEGLDACLKHYKKLYGQNWRKQIKDKNKLLEFFSGKSVNVHLRWRHHPQGKLHGFVIKSQLMRVEMTYRWLNPDKASWEGLKWAFHILDLQIHRAKAKAKRKRVSRANFGIRSERERIKPERNWGEEVRKSKQ